MFEPVCLSAREPARLACRARTQQTAAAKARAEESDLEKIERA